MSLQWPPAPSEEAPSSGGTSAAERPTGSWSQLEAPVFADGSVPVPAAAQLPGRCRPI
jgi:hypothetical protein